MIEITYNPDDIDKYFKATERDFQLSTRYALNKAIKHGRKLAEKELSNTFGFTKKGSPNVNDYLDHTKLKMKDVRGDKASRLYALFRKKRGLLNYVLGPKTPQKLKGVPVHKRRKLYVKLKQVGVHPKSFIALGKNKQPHVFSKGKDKMFRQTIADAWQVTQRSKFHNKLMDEVESMIQREFHKKFYRAMEEK